MSEYQGHSGAGFTVRTSTHLMPRSGERTRHAADEALACCTSAISVLHQATAKVLVGKSSQMRGI